MKSALILALFLTATAAHAGGPFAVEEEPPVSAERTEDGRIPPWVIPVVVGLVLVAALGGGGSTCNTPDDEPDLPAAGGC